MDSRLTRAAGGASEDLESMEGGWGESNLHFLKLGEAREFLADDHVGMIHILSGFISEVSGELPQVDLTNLKVL